MKVNLLWLRTGAILGASGIMLGALAAHALKNILTVQQLTSFETGVRYQLLMAFYFLIVAILPLQQKFQKTLFVLALVGTLFFSGSIYGLSLQAAAGLKLGFLGPITPLGGLLMIAAWALLTIAIAQKKSADYSVFSKHP
jgi:uncharacterized membrane protein YgdD (TMEM256/DUF423 family)